MNIIYHCRGGAHSSPLAAALHLKMIDANTPPSAVALMRKVPDYDTIDQHTLGHIRKVGTDEFGNDVFCLGRRKAANIVVPAVKDAVRLNGGNPDDFLFVNTMPAVTPLMKLGGFTSRALGLVSIGRPIVIAGTRHGFPKLVEIVKKTKSALKMGKPPHPTSTQKTEN